MCIFPSNRCLSWGAGEVQVISSMALSACCKILLEITRLAGIRHQSRTCIWAQSSSELPPALGELASPSIPSSTWDGKWKCIQDCNRVFVSLISWPGQLLSLNPCGRPKILARMPFFGIYALFCRTFGDLRTLLSMPVFSPHMKAQLDLLSLSMWINACQGHEQMVYSLFFVQGN